MAAALAELPLLYFLELCDVAYVMAFPATENW